MESLLDSAQSWGDTLGNLAGKYLDYRRVQSQDALNASEAQYKIAAMQQQAAAAAADGESGWLMPALLIGGGLLVVALLVRS